MSTNDDCDSVGKSQSSSNSLWSFEEEKFAYNSLFCLRDDNKFRIITQKIVSSKLFIRTMNVMIILNAIFLIFDTIESMRDVNTYSNIIFTVIFIIECILKIIAYGFILEQYTYLRDPWNWLDFIVVVTGLISFLPSVSANLLVLRTFRLFRPIKAMSIMPNMKRFLSTLFNSFIDLANVFLLLLFFFIIFAVFGLSLWQDTFYSQCRVAPSPSNGQFPIVEGYENILCGGELSCPKDSYCVNSIKFYPKDLTRDYIDSQSYNPHLNYGLTNFKNVLNSLFVVFMATTCEGWVKIMAMLMNGYNYYASFIFFVLCVIINYFFMLNLIVAVLIYNLEESRKYKIIHENTTKSKRKESHITIKNMHNHNEDTMRRKYKRKYLPFRHITKPVTEFQWTPIFNRIKSIKCFENIKRSSHYHKNFLIGYICYYIYKQPLMQYFFFLCILINTLLLSLDRVDMGNVEYQVIEIFNIVLVAVFMFEIVIHIFGVSIGIFFCDFFNVFDFIIVAFSFIEIILKKTTDVLSESTGSIGTIFRTLRVMRIFKLFPQWKNFQIIMESIWETIIRMVDYIILFLIFVYIYTLLGFSLFSKSMKDKDFNFTDFPESLSTVFYLIIGDHWNEIYMNAYLGKENNNIAVIIYFITIILFGHVTMVNIFLAYLIENFEHSRQHRKKNLIVQTFLLNIAYSYTSNHNLISSEEQNKYSHNQSKRVLFLTDVLLRLLGGKNCDYSQLTFLKKTKIDFDNMTIVNSKDMIIEMNVFLKKRRMKEYNFESEMKKAFTKIDVTEDYYDFYYDYHVDPSFMKVNRTHKVLIDNRPLRITKTMIPSQASSFPILDKNLLMRGSDKMVKPHIKRITDSVKNTNIPSKHSVSNKRLDERDFSPRRKQQFRKMHTINPKRRESVNENDEYSIMKNEILIKKKESKKRLEMEIMQRQNKKRPCIQKVCQYMKESSLFIFHYNSFIRRVCKYIVRHKAFNYAIFALILGNCVLLSFDSPWMDPNSTDYKVMYIFNIIFNVCFIIEGVLKIISDDFIYKAKEEKNLLKLNKTTKSVSFEKSISNSISKSQAIEQFNSSYNKKTDHEKEEFLQRTLNSLNTQKAYIWSLANLIDFICIIIGIVDLCESDPIIRSFRAFRVFRALKHLRLIFQFTNLHLVIKCLINSLPSVWNVFVVCGIVIYIFTLLGVNIFKNQLLYYCSDYSSKDKEICLKTGFNWLYNYENYQNFFYSLKTLFEIMIKDGWGEMMNLAAKKYGYKYVYFYYIIYIIIAHLFILNLFVSILIQSYRTTKKNDKKFRALSEPEKEWINAQKIMMKFKPIVRTENNVTKAYKCFEKFVLSKLFNHIIFTIILLSIITLIIQYSGSSKAYNDTLEIINYVFTAIFNIELILKIIVIKKAFFYSSWNRFDIVIIIICDILVILNILSRTNVISVQTLTSLPIILRTLRILQIFRILSSFSKIRALIGTLLYLGSTIINIGLLLILLLLVYGNIGMSIFGTVPYREMINANMNFRNFLSSSLILFQVTSGEDWYKIMNELAYHDCRDPSSIQYKQDYYCINFNIICYDDIDVSYTSMKELGRYSCGNEFSYFFFISFVILCPIFVMSLCIVMVIEGFADSMYENEGLLTEEYMEKFVSVWSEYDPNFSMIIRPHEFVLILKELGPPLGFNYDRLIYMDGMKMIKERRKYLTCKAIIEDNTDNQNDRNVVLDNLTFGFNSFYLSKNKKFHTTDIEVLKIVEKFNIIATDVPNTTSKQYSYALTKKQTTPDNVKGINNDEPQLQPQPQPQSQPQPQPQQKDEWNNMRIHFIDACLALSRFAISKTENIAFNNLRFNVVGNFTKNMWQNNYARSDREVVNSLFDGTKRECQGKLSSKLAARFLFDKALNKWRQRAQEKIKERNRQENIFLYEEEILPDLVINDHTQRHSEDLPLNNSDYNRSKHHKSEKQEQHHMSNQTINNDNDKTIILNHLENRLTTREALMTNQSILSISSFDPNDYKCVNNNNNHK